MSWLKPFPRNRFLFLLSFLFLVLSSSLAFSSSAFSASTAPAPEPGLLFHLSGDNGFTADFATGNPEPTMLNGVTIVKDGAKGSAFSNPHFTQLFAYESWGNMFAERGTFSFFWRPRDPVGSGHGALFTVNLSFPKSPCPPGCFVRYCK